MSHAFGKVGFGKMGFGKMGLGKKAYTLQTGIFPAVWKTATVVTLFKKADKSQVSNYRPVSLLVTAGKLFQAVIFKRLYDPYSPHFSKLQFGSRTNCSTVLQLKTFLQKVYKGIGTNNEIDVVFTGFLQ